MSDPVPPPFVTVTVQTIPADTVMAAVGDPTRRRILVALADGKPRRCTDLKSVSGKRFDATLKHVVALRNAGLIVGQDDPTDKRRQIYTLSPALKVGDTPMGRMLDFGYGLLRL